MAVVNSDAADLLDRLDLSMSSIDMTNTSLAMHEEKDSEISGVGRVLSYIILRKENPLGEKYIVTLNQPLLLLI